MVQWNKTAKQKLHNKNDMMLTKLNFKIFLSFITAFISAVLLLFNSGCSTRNQPPVISGDSTIVYLPKNPDDISADITLCSKISKKTSQPIGKGTIFSIKDNAKLFALINLKNREYYTNKALMFHIDWTDPEGNSFYTKRIDLPTNDSSSSLNSSISISPDKRQAGSYTLKFYLFRELIAEKNFLLTNEQVDNELSENKNIAEKITAKIMFCRKINAKTGKLIDAGKIFTIKDKASVYASVSITIQDTSINQPLTFITDWIDPDDSSFYRKKTNVTPNSASFTISSSISVSTKKRLLGNYKLKIYLGDNLIAENDFKLVKKDKVEKNILPKLKKESVSAQILFCKKISKKSGQPINVDSVFVIKDEAKVFAVISLEKRDTTINNNLKMIIDWVGLNDSSVYKKRMDITLADKMTSVTSSISITPAKKKPGIYYLRIYLSKVLIAERKFELVQELE
jgi:hypothetical protein